jgi:sugar phosphate permease
MITSPSAKRGGATAASRADQPYYRWYVVGMLWAISFFNYADRQAIFSVFPLLEKQMGLTTVQLGLLGSAFAWVYGLGGQFAGIIVDRVRRKTAVLSGLYVWSAICTVTAFFSGFRALFILRALEGLGETFYYPASMSLISDYHGKSTRSKAIGIHQTSVYVGTIAGGFFAGLIGQYYGWRWSFIVFGSLGILLGFVLNRYLIEPRRGAAELIDQGLDAPDAHVARLSVSAFLKIVWTTPTMLFLMGAFLCANFVAVVLLSWMPAFLYSKFHMGLAMAGLTATIYVQLASMVGAVGGGWLADFLSRRTPRGRILVQAIGVLGGAPFVAVCGLTQSVFVLILALTGWGLFKGLYDANIFASAFDVVRPEARGTASGFMNTVGWLGGGGTAPLVVGLIARNHGIGVGIALASIVYVAAGALLLIAAFGFVKADARRMRQSMQAVAGQG